MLPLHLQMEIDLSAREHSQRIAEGFADARQKLLGDPPAKRAEWVHPAMIDYQNRISHYPDYWPHYLHKGVPAFGGIASGLNHYNSFGDCGIDWPYIGNRMA